MFLLVKKSLTGTLIKLLLLQCSTRTEEAVLMCYGVIQTTSIVFPDVYTYPAHTTETMRSLLRVLKAFQIEEHVILCVRMCFYIGRIGFHHSSLSAVFQDSQVHCQYFIVQLC